MRTGGQQSDRQEDKQAVHLSRSKPLPVVVLDLQGSVFCTINGIYGFDKKYTALYVDITWRFDSNAHEQQREKSGS